MVFKNMKSGVKNGRFLTVLRKTLYFCRPKKKKPNTMEKMQFSAAVVLSLLTLTLVLLPKRGDRDPLPYRSRWFMAIGTFLLALEFVFQVKLGLRAMGLAQSVMLNLFMFVPASWMLDLGILHLQRKGRIVARDWWVGIIAWVAVTALLFEAQYSDRDPIVFNGRELPLEEIIGSVIFLAMQCHFTYLHFRELRRMHRSLNNYYDRDMSYLLRSLESAIEILAVVAVLAPQAIFNSGWLLGVFGLLFLLGIYYFVISFVIYVVGNDLSRVIEAEQHSDEKEPEEVAKEPAPVMAEEDCRRIENAVNRWLEQDKYLRSGLTVQAVADEMKIPRYQLTAWLKTTQHELFSSWLTHLRIEEAKRVMTAHPEWSNDVIAEHCGFGSRTYFQTVFRKQTGMTPADFLNK